MKKTIRKKKVNRTRKTTRNKTSKQKQNGAARLNKNEKLKKVNCSPKDKNEINDFTCYTDKSLYKLRDLWNVRHPDKKINTNNTKEIHELLTKYLSSVCNKESCWLKQKSQFGKMSSDMSESFAPESPKEWKNNPIIFERCHLHHTLRVKH